MNYWIFRRQKTREYLAVDTQEKHHLTVAALTSFVIRLSRLRPLLLIVEDLQWADPSTLQVLDAIIAQSNNEKLFAIFTSRSEFTPTWRDELIPIPLAGLDEKSSSKIIETIAGADKLPPPVARQLIAKSGGVPLFLEETSRHLIAQLPEDQIQDAGVVGVYSQDQFAVPDSLQDSLNARLDRLGEAKTFAQLAAVFGGDFSYSLLNEIAAQEDIDADDAMDVLLDDDLLVVLADETDAGEDRYAFRHALFQDAAYHSLLIKTRQRYHLQIAEHLQRDDIIARKQPELIAHHYSHTTHLARAVELWIQAGEHAIAQSAAGEAVQHLNRGLAVIKNLPEDDERSANELSLLLNLGVALTARTGYHGTRVTETYSRALTLAEAGDDTDKTWTALYGLWRCLVSQAAFTKSIRVSVKLKSLSQRADDAKLLMSVFGLQGMTRMVTGKLVSADAFYDKAVQLYERNNAQNKNCDDAQNENQSLGVRFGQDPYVTLRGLGAVNKLLRGDIAQSQTEIAKSVSAARATKHPYTVAETLRVAAMYQQIAGDQKQLRELAEETITLSETYGFDGLRAAANLFLLHQKITQPNAKNQAKKMRRMKQNLRQYETHYGLLFLPYFHSLFAESRLAAGNPKAALKIADGALTLIKKHGENWWQAPLLAIKSQAAAQANTAPKSKQKTWLKTGIKTAEEQQANLFADRLKKQLAQL